MEFRPLARLWRPALGASLIAGLALAPMARTAAQVSRAATPIYLTAYSQTHTTMVRNFNPFQPSAYLDFTLGAIYEPLLIITTAGGGHVYPWLATGYTWTNANKTLVLTIRHGVRWSDGVPLTAGDVLFTFTYGRTHPVADQTGMWSSGQLLDVARVGADRVALTFKTVNTTVLQQVASSMSVIPQHIWSTIANPAAFANLNPVGSGPFTNVTYFSPQEFILGKNPYYWQPGKPAVDGIKVPAFSSNDAGLAALLHGDLDWISDFVPNVDKVFVSRDPAHNHYYFANNTTPVSLYFNTSVYPYSLPAFRKAVSNAINRSTISTIAEYGYEPPSEALGIAGLFPSWLDAGLAGQARAAATYNPAVARQTLSAAGFAIKGNSLLDPRGNAVQMTLEVPAGWSDWIQSLQLIARDLKAVGIVATIKQVDQNAFFADRARGTINGGWFAAPQAGANPYQYFYGTISRESLIPTGQDATLHGGNNQERWASDQASQLLARFRQTSDPALQHRLAAQLERIWLDNLPVIPLMYQANWYEYSTRHVTGFPDAHHSYAQGSTYLYPDDVKIFTSLTPAM